MTLMTLSNVIAYCAQIAILVIVCAGLPRVLGLRVPIVQYVFWRVVLLLCLLLPLLQPWRPIAVEVTSILDGAVASTTSSAVLQPSGSTPSVTRMDPGLALALVLLAGALVRLLWLAIGITRLHSMRRAPANEAAAGFEDLRTSIGADVPIVWSPHVRHPVTFGLRRPVVLLPVALKAVDQGTQRAVVAHELHHVKRRDWGWLLAEEVLRGLFWFHPAMWWLISRVQLARETVVDELSILVTNARRTYLDALLAFADDGFASSSAFSARRHLFHRVMLLSKEGDMSSVRVAAGSGLLLFALATGTWGATKTFPLYTEVAAQSPLPPRDPVPASAYHRQAVLLWEQARKASLTPQEQLELVSQGITAENKAIALDPDYVEAITYKNILLRMKANLTADAEEAKQLLREAEDLRGRAIEIRRTQPYVPAHGEPPPPPPPPPPTKAVMEFMPQRFAEEVAERRPVRIGGNIKAPAKLHDVKPVYPPDAQVDRIQGVVIVEILVAADGSVVDGRILRSIERLDEAALEAVLQWRYAPTIVDGVARSVLMTVTVNFRID